MSNDPRDVDVVPGAAPAPEPGKPGGPSQSDRKERRAGPLRRMLRGIFGSLSWEPPGWLRALGRGAGAGGGWVRRHRGAALGVVAMVVALAIGVGAGMRWYEKRPKPKELTVRVDAPAAMRLEEGAKPDTLRLLFSGSAAPLALVKKPVTAGIVMSPPLPGAWRWDSDKVLVFTPQEDWPVGESFVVKLRPKELLAEGVRLAESEVKFDSAPLTGRITQSEFYQDPQDASQKKVVATVSFSHPIDAAELDKHLSIELVTKKDGALTRTPYRAQVSWDKLRGTAFIHSAPVAIPDHDSEMAIKISKGVRAARGGQPLQQEIGASVTVPGIYDFLRVSEASLTLVNNAQYEPEQVLIVEMNTGVVEAEARKAVSAYVLPLRKQDDNTGSREPYHWSTTEISPEVIKQSEPLRLEQIPSDREYATVHSFRYQAEVGRKIYVKVNRGMRSFGGYVLDKTADYVLSVPEFPKELKIMSAGALLSLSGEQKVSLYARDVDAVRVEIGRVLPGQLQHLVAQNSGNFQTPEFYSYRFGSENITEIFSEVQPLPRPGHGKAQYSSVNLGRYLEGRGRDRQGLFFLKVESWDPERKVNTGKTDSRLVLVTDLGLLVKDNVDGTHDVFVQSLKTGEPVRGARVEVVGKNGMAVLNQETDGEGHAHFPKLSGYGREQAPLLYLATRGNDLSFLPYGRNDRYLDFSRFQIEGIHDSDKPQGLTAYLFSDRGIYRPGDEIRVGLIVKASDWKQRLLGVPVEITVDDARGLTVKRDKIRLSESGFEEIRYPTLESAPTGTWNISVHVVKDDRAAGLLGSTSVRVQEFLPDRLKMSARLSKESLEGWVTPEELKARVTLLNLFGTPATARLVKASIQLSPTLPSFSRFRDYQFSDPMRAKESLNDSLADDQTDDQGEAEFDLDLKRFAAATYRLRFIAQGFEAEGGRSVAAEAQVTVSPMPYLVGWKADGDLGYVSKGSQRAVQLVAVGPQATSIAQPGVRAILYERRFLSVLVRQTNGTYKYESIRKETAVSDKKITIAAGGLAYPLPTDKAGDFAIVLKNEKEQELNRIEFSVAGEGNLTRSLEKNAELQVKLKSADVAPGEELEMQIKAPYTGAGLITIERDRVLTYKWFRTTTTASVQTIRVPEDMEGNGYVSVSFIRGLDSSEVFMSPLSYGVVPFSLSRARRTAKITLTTPDLVKPGDAFKMKYSTDRPTQIVVFAVDEGILQVAKYQTPDPLSYFFQKRALEVKTAQILDLVLPEFSQVMRAAPGGDGEGGMARNLNPFKRRRDKPVAYWSGIVDAGPKERELVYTVPDTFNGTLRVMAVAVAADAVGVFHKKAQVRGDFVLSPNVPLFAAPGDEFEVTVGVANNVVGSGKDAKIQLELRTSQHVELVGASKVTLPIGELREGVASFRLRAKDTLGSASLTFVAALGQKSGKLTTDLSVRPLVHLLTTSAIGHLPPGGGKKVIEVPRSLFADYRVLSAGMSPLPLSLSRGLLQYLEKFPHGCTEQIVSQTFPSVVLRGRAEFGLPIEAADKAWQRTLMTLRSRQNDDGGFGLWDNPNQVSDFASVYATHFLIEAKEHGLAVPQEMLKRSLEYLSQLASRETDSLPDERTRAYAVYVLTRSGVVTSQQAASVGKTLENSYKGWQKDLAGIYLGATLKLLKQERAAQKILAEAKLGEVKDTEADFHHFYDPLVRDAQLVYILSRHFPERLGKQDGDALLALVTPLSQERYNTLSSSYTILALEAYAQVAQAKLEPGQLGVAEILANNQQRPLVLPQALLPSVAFTPEARKLLLTSESPLRIYYQVTQSGFDRDLPQTALKQKLEVLREITDEKGNPLSQVKLGEEARVHLKLRGLLPGQTLWDLAIVDLLPGGFEVVVQPRQAAEPEPERDSPSEGGDGEGGGEAGEGEAGGEGDGQGSERTPPHESTDTPAQLPIALDGSSFRPIYGDVREDRVVLYGSIGADMQEFVYAIKATNAGTYTLPSLSAEGMYDRGAVARSTGGGKIVIVK
ncbi:MAG: alpha-2-macroglobulin [Polyangia bacterium]